MRHNLVGWFFLAILLAFSVACGGDEPGEGDGTADGDGENGEEINGDGDGEVRAPIYELEFLSQPTSLARAGQAFTVSLGFVDPDGEILDAEGVEITLELSRGTFADGESQKSASIDSFGLANFSLTIEKADIGYVLIARGTRPEGEAEVLNSKLFDVMAGTVSSSFSSITGEDYVLADGQSTAEVQVKLADSFGNPLSGVNPVIAAAGAKVEGCSSTDIKGLALCAISSEEPGAKLLEILEPLTMTGDSIIFLRACQESGTPFGGGDGSREDPYLLCSAQQISQIGLSPETFAGYFVLTADVNLSNIQNFTSIGSEQDPFTGVFDGRGFTLQNLTIHDSDENDIGFFGVTGWNSEIRDLHLRAVDLMGSNRVGALVGQSRSTIKGASATGVISAESLVGGLVGTNTGWVDRSFADVDVVGDSLVGGLVGQNSRIAARPYPNFTGVLTESYALGDVTSSSDEMAEVGGFVGTNAGIIADSFAMGAVTAGSAGRVGGLAGSNVLGASFSRSYAVGEVSGGQRGGLVGFQTSSGEAFLSFWDTATSQLSAGFGDTNGGQDGVGLTTSQFEDSDLFTEWDFDQVWMIGASPDGNVRPILRWME